MAFRSLINTQRQQREVEEKVGVRLQSFASASRHHHSHLLELWRDQHIDYLLHGYQHLAPSFSVLDANRPWLCYWILHSLALLGVPIDLELRKRTIDFLTRCQHPEGGYGGGPGQMPHLATTYAAVSALVTIGGNEALASINREKVLQFLLRMKDPSGGFRVHENGEMDVRGCYTAIAVGHMLDLLTPSLIHKVAGYIVSCQSYEGGIGGEPGAEAHGGYTYCGLATLVLINQAHFLDLPRLVNWSVFRQRNVEGGFQGRVNKLVDGCYSFWQGGLFPLVQRLTEHIMFQPIDDCSISGNVSRSDSVGHHLMKREHGSSNEVEGTSIDVAGHRHASFETYREQVTGANVPSTRTVPTRTGTRVKAETLFPPIVKWGSSTVDSGKDTKTHGNEGHIITHASKSLAALNFPATSQVGPLFNTQALQGYILLCCQVFEGGLRDKPGKPCDYYHTCYCLSGLSTAQYSTSKKLGTLPLPCSVLGPYDNLLEPTHPLCNVVLERYYSAHNFFGSFPVT